MLVDFYKTYRLDIRGLEDGSLDPDFIAALLDGLDSNCLTNRILYPDLALTVEEWMLNSIEHNLRISNYRWTKDAKTGRNKPKPLFTPQKTEEEQNNKPEEKLARLDIDSMKSLVEMYT